MKQHFFLFLTSLFVFLPARGQETFYANERQVVALFFSSPIRQAVVGADHFTFSYNNETGQTVGLLQGNPGGESNLLVITTDGNAYNFSLAYRKRLSKEYHFIQQLKSIGDVRNQKMVTLPNVGPDSIAVSRKTLLDMESFEKGSEYVLQHDTPLLKASRKKGMALRLRELFYTMDWVFLEMEIENRTPIAFEVDGLEVFTVNGKRGKRSSHQKLELKPRYRFRFPEVVWPDTQTRTVLVLPKFTLGDAERLRVELREKKGSRYLNLKWKGQ